mmetsp:Transcript_94939/g.238117  ORF Transcript_94939/g.238117 Transcript_94939/m.238117 type:complete len:494 (+) Transcript_94939:232-1713(+)
MAMDLQATPVNELLYASFNQDFTCFACGTESGFKVFSTDPFRLTRSRDFAPGGGIGVVAMLFRTNILAFAGGGKSPKYQPHKVVIWDDLQARTIAELSFRSAVKAVRLRRDLVVVVLNNKVYVYGFRSLSLLDSIETTSNPKGLCCLSIGADRAVLVCPGMQQGRALVVFYPRAFAELQAPVARERTTIIAAHESAIAAMATDYNGMLLATASDKGTIVRVYDTTSGMRRQELRRGADRAEIHSLAFSPTGDFLVVSSDKGTIHIFAIGRPTSVVSSSSTGGGYSDGGAGGSAGSGSGAGSSNAKSSLQRISRVLPAYFSSEWSLAQFRVPDYRCISAFGADPHTIVAVCANGSYYKARFDPNKGGEMVREEYAQFDDASSDSSPIAAAPEAAAAMVDTDADAKTQAQPLSSAQPMAQDEPEAEAAPTSVSASASLSAAAMAAATGSTDAAGASGAEAASSLRGEAEGGPDEEEAARIQASEAAAACASVDED